MLCPFPRPLYTPIHREDAYTVHGAFLSGEREALNIAKWWRQYHDDM